jgi:hypothetical protein
MIKEIQNQGSVDMKALDFNLSEQIKFDFDKGITSFQSERIVITSANSYGLLRQELIEIVGLEKAREIFLCYGFQNGYSDFMDMKLGYEFDTEMELLSAGPVIHTWQGIVKAKPTEIRFNRKTGEFFFSGIWENSFEAEQHLLFNEVSEEPVCWSLMGYASGWSTAFFGDLLIAIEPFCRGKGDKECGWLIMPPSVWGSKADMYMKAYQKFL